MSEPNPSNLLITEVEMLIGPGVDPKHIWASIPYAGRLLVHESTPTHLGNHIKVGDRIEKGIPEDIKTEIGKYQDGWSDL